MSDVAATTRSAATPRAPARAPARAAPASEDVRAMGEAFARARGTMAEQPQGLGRNGKPLGMPGRAGREAEAATVAQWGATEERVAIERREGDRHGDQGFGGFGQQAAGTAPVPVVQAPSPHVDPSGFAQMLADLWTRDNGKGPREVRVKFGRATWPALGAALVRSADGLLDVSVEMASGAPPAPLALLGQALQERGIAVGQVTAGA